MKTMKYSLQDFTNITFNGFDIKLPQETLDIISQITSQVGSPTYIKTPIFTKKDKRIEDEYSNKKKIGRRVNNFETINNEDWESFRTFHTTKIEQKVGLDAQIDLIRSSLNKMSDKNYNEHYQNINDILSIIVKESNEEEMTRVGKSIFEIASNNRFYSKLYADLYSSLIKDYEIMKKIFDNNFNNFLELFKTIEYVNPDEDYNGFCKINKINENRKSLSLFFVNLMNNQIISEDKIMELTYDLLDNIYQMIKLDNKKNEVDEFVENISILYNKTLFQNNIHKIDGKNIEEIIQLLAHSKTKTYPSLSNKSIFKYMDILGL
jgi:hypothetical protein